MALKLTVYIGDESWPLKHPEPLTQEVLQEMADRVLENANRGRSYFIYRSGDVTVEEV